MNTKFLNKPSQFTVSYKNLSLWGIHNLLDKYFPQAH